MDWIDLTQDSDQWRVVVNTAMNLWVPWNFGKFLSAAQLAAFQEGLSFIKLEYLMGYKNILLHSKLCILKPRVRTCSNANAARKTVRSLFRNHVLFCNVYFNSYVVCGLVARVPG
jgi:hypothetical protein